MPSIEKCIVVGGPNTKGKNSDLKFDTFSKWEHIREKIKRWLAEIRREKKDQQNMNCNLRVLIEPRACIRIIQLVMSIFAFGTTVGFDTESTFEVVCTEFEVHRLYKFGYPFKICNTKLRVPHACTDIMNMTFQQVAFSFDSSSNAEFFVTTAVLTLVFTIGIIVVYVFMNRLYSTNPMAPMVDLMATGVLTVFCFAGSCVWAQGVSDVNYYSNPSNLFQHMDICNEPNVCRSLTSGNFALLYVSLVSGFTNCMLCICSLWFVYKETSFYKQAQPPAMIPPMEQQQAPPIQQKDIGHKMGGHY